MIPKYINIAKKKISQLTKNKKIFSTPYVKTLPTQAQKRYPATNYSQTYTLRVFAQTVRTSRPPTQEQSAHE